jgi:hypothetical protein
MKIDKTLILSIVIVLLIILNIKQWSDPDKIKTITIEVPEIKGSFKLNYDVLQFPIKQEDSIIYKTKDSIIYTENKFNKKLAEDYKELKSEFDRYKLFLEAITIENYSKTFEDSYLTGTVTGGVQGEVQSMAFDYRLKARKAQTDMKVKNYQFVIGPSVGMTYSANGFIPYLGLGITYKLIRF